MMNQYLKWCLIGFVSVFFLTQCKNKDSIAFTGYELKLDQPDPELQAFDSTLIASFFKKFPKLASYKKEVLMVYKKHQYNYLWYDSKGKKETADVLYNRINGIAADGILQKVPYKDIFDKSYLEESKPDVTNELLLTSYYFFYTDKVLEGIDYAKRKELGWFLDRDSVSYVNFLDTLLVNPGLVNKQTQLIKQYYLLKKDLQKHHNIALNGGWGTVNIDEDFKNLNPSDTSDRVTEIRKRLYLSGDLTENSGSNVYDLSLQEGLDSFLKRHGFVTQKVINKRHIEAMNVSVEERIKTIVINMERCRWISPNIAKAKEYIVVNIPAYRLLYIKNDSIALQSDVVVGTTMNQTVVFSGKLKYIVFSPYWNVPQSIIKNEILPGIKRDANYLAKHNMEWNNGNVRQKPGPANSLGLVKFIFPNNNNIYFHDTPSKSLFQREARAFSHGCIRVARPKDLAQAILIDDKKWTSEKIDAAMNLGTEKWHTLKNEIPVHIGYFTAWVDREGKINFYNDIYKRDAQMEVALYPKS